MIIKYDPYSVFRKGISPASLYARKKWLGESESDEWKNDYRKTVADIVSGGILPDNNMTDAVKNLFALHLTVRDKTPEITDAVLKLLEKAEDILMNKDRTVIADNELSDLPFAGAEKCFVIPPAALFLAEIFDLKDSRPFEKLFNRMIDLTRDSISDRRRILLLHNFFRVLAVDPVTAALPETDSILDRLLDLQLESGDWKDKIPFFQAVNAAAHINSEKSDILFTKALKLIVSSQNNDSSWGNGESKEWNSFLTVHALKNKNIL